MRVNRGDSSRSDLAVSVVTPAAPLRKFLSFHFNGAEHLSAPNSASSRKRDRWAAPGPMCPVSDQNRDWAAAPRFRTESDSARVTPALVLLQFRPTSNQLPPLNPSDFFSASRWESARLHIKLDLRFQRADGQWKGARSPLYIMVVEVDHQEQWSPMSFRLITEHLVHGFKLIALMWRNNLWS